MSYIDLTNKFFTLTVDATTATQKRVLDYVRANFEVMAKPYAMTTPDQLVRENLDRATALVELRDKYLKETAEHATKFANSTTEHAKAVQETMQAASNTMGQVVASNLNFVKEATATQIDGFTKHVEAVSAN